LVLALIAVGGFIVFTHLRARRLGLPPPQLSSYIPSGPLGILKEKIASLRRGRARGAGGFEDTSYAGAGGRRVAAFDTDETWDARVDNTDPYNGGAYASRLDVGRENPYEPVHEDPAPMPQRGRSRSREPETNPFGDDAEVGSIKDLRGVSPRPMA